ncbi:hypothetical protein HPB47_000257 [Ixodes persulcatus]|uniref:Uncharacterized protein n=1 Tax=Ixodes persulcatus TaxID=34615 RepID=A0AC60PTL1_IXOPE|nr:hypothetical protein HPB47_000257 [Ixodes persulcatus]
MAESALMWLLVQFEGMVSFCSQHWIMSSLLQDPRSTKYVASFSAAFLLVGVLVLLVNVALVWTPSLWHLKQRGTSASPQQLVPTHLELSPYLGRTQLAAGARRLPNFLPDSGDLEVTEEGVADVFVHLPKRRKVPDNDVNEAEALTSLRAARHMTQLGKLEKALKLFQHALMLDPSHADILTEYGEFLENHQQDFIKADHMYTRALVSRPDHSQARRSLALVNRQRTLPVVEKLDEKQLTRIDKKRLFLVQIPEGDPSLKRMKKEAYFQHIHHTVAIEGNTMSLAETRTVVETRTAVPGKSILEHNEILGLDLALRFVNNSLVNKALLSVADVLAMHRRILGHVNPVEAGTFRRSQEMQEVLIKGRKLKLEVEQLRDLFAILTCRHAADRGYVSGKPESVAHGARDAKRVIHKLPPEPRRHARELFSRRGVQSSPGLALALGLRGTIVVRGVGPPAPFTSLVLFSAEAFQASDVPFFGKGV